MSPCSFVPGSTLPLGASDVHAKLSSVGNRWTDSGLPDYHRYYGNGVGSGAFYSHSGDDCQGEFGVQVDRWRDLHYWHGWYADNHATLWLGYH